MPAEIHGLMPRILQRAFPAPYVSVQKAVAQESEQPAGPEELQDLELEKLKLPVEMVAMVKAARQLAAEAVAALEGRIIPEETGV